MINLKDFLSRYKITLILVLIMTVLASSGIFAFQKFVGNKENTLLEEIELTFDPEGPYGLLFPRRDGNALILNLKRTASYEKIQYELAYNSEGVDRGVVGDIDTKDKKGEYEQEILFGTCSKNVCKYDKGVENGTLVLMVQKEGKIYKMTTLWRLQKPEVIKGLLTSGDGHFSYQIDVKTSELSLYGFTIINDLSGLPKLPSGKKILDKIYAINVPITKSLGKGQVTIEVSEQRSNAKIARFSESENKWIEYETKIDNNNKLNSSVDSGGIFAVLIPQE